MSGLFFRLQGKWALQIEQGGDVGCFGGHRRKKVEILEPKSVLDQRRSPSPSTSTLSTSLGGGTDTAGAGVAAVSGSNTIKWPRAAAGVVEAVGREKEWVSELHSIPPALEVGGEKRGMGVDDWDIMFSEAAAVSHGQEQTFLHWIMRDVEDTSAITKQQHPMVEFDTGSVGLIDHGFAFEPIAGFGGGSTILLPAASASFASSSCSSAQPVRLAQTNQFAAATGAKNPSFVPLTTGMASLPLSFPPATFFQEPGEEKPLLFAPNLLTSQHQQSQLASSNSGFLFPSPELFQNQNLLPHPEHFLRLNFSQSQPNQSSTVPHNQTIPCQLQKRPMKPKSSATGDEADTEAMAIQQHQQQSLVNQLFKAAELVEAGNFVDAHGILARLNHQLPSPIGKPLLRSAFYFKEALQLLSSAADPQAAAASFPFHHNETMFTTRFATPLDVVLKLSAYKAFSEVSPILQFTNFTATQALLEELGSEDCIHIIDFDIGVGGQWSSFMQEIVQRWSPAVPLLKITAFFSPCAFHPLELRLARDNLSHFAADLNIPFEINISSIEAFDPAEILVLSAGSNEAIIVNLTIGAWQGPSFPTLLCLVKQLLPKIVISVDHGCDSGELSFSHHFLHAFQSCMVLLDSIDAAGTNLDVANKIERFVLKPRIENSVIGRHQAADKMLPWRTQFASAGFVPVQFSNFTEMQAECLLKRVQVRGFHTEKHQDSLYLYWQRGELASVSAWRC